MLTKQKILELFKELNIELKAQQVKGEIGLCGGAVMCVVFNTRESTKDIDAIFEPTAIMRNVVDKLARKKHLHKDWLNDAAKGFFLSEPPRVPVLSLSHLNVWAPSADYMLAMKCLSARFDSHDRDDVIFLVRHLGLKKPDEVFEIIQRYYPDKHVPAKTQFFIEEILVQREI